MLHVHGGSIVLDKLRAAGLPGAFLEWVDVLCQGPTPAGDDHAAWLDVRAGFLDAAYGAARGPARPRLAAQDTVLARALAAEDELVLWFNADWFCQAILVCLLGSRLASASPLSRQGKGNRGSGTGSGARVSLISIGAYPGVDDGRGCTLAFLSDGQLRELFAHRAPVTPDVMAAARTAWDALCSPDPGVVEAALAGGLDALPFAAAGLARHLREFPVLGSGVNRTERHVLEALRDGPRDAVELFPLVAEREERRWITDLMFAHVLRRLAAGARPLVTLDPTRPLAAMGRPPTADAFRAARVTLTAAGRDVLAGALDWIAAAGVDRWVGGVHLTPLNDWRWDEAGGRFMEPAP